MTESGYETSEPGYDHGYETTVGNLKRGSGHVHFVASNVNRLNSAQLKANSIISQYSPVRASRWLNSICACARCRNCGAQQTERLDVIMSGEESRFMEELYKMLPSGFIPSN